MDALPYDILARLNNDLQPDDDPRAANARHRLVDLLTIAILGVLGGADDYPGIVEYARDEHDWLKTFLPLPHGIPSISTFRRLFAAIRPAALERVLRRWSGDLTGTLAGKQVTIDGKTLRGSFDHAWDANSALHLVSAWCVESNLVLTQQAVADKSNEITAIPELIDLLDLKGAVVTIDAMGTQTAIARKIVRAGADYVLAVKDNHPTLADSLRRHMDEMILEKFKDVAHSYHESTEAGHDRVETRKTWATGDLSWLARRGEWMNLSSVVLVERTRRENAQAEPTVTRSYYISSLKNASAERLGGLIRGHWSIENQQHWGLDVAFNEDQSRVRKQHGNQNLAVLRRIAHGLLRRDKSVKVGVKTKRLKAGRNHNYLLQVLLGGGNAK